MESPLLLTGQLILVHLPERPGLITSSLLLLATKQRVPGASVIDKSITKKILPLNISNFLLYVILTSISERKNEQMKFRKVNGSLMCLMQRESQGTIIQEPSGKETCSRYESYLRNLFIAFIYYLINISYHTYRKKQTVYKEKSIQTTKCKGTQFVNFKCKKI